MDAEEEQADDAVEGEDAEGEHEQDEDDLKLWRYLLGEDEREVCGEVVVSESTKCVDDVVRRKVCVVQAASDDPRKAELTRH